MRTLKNKLLLQHIPFIFKKLASSNKPLSKKPIDYKVNFPKEEESLSNLLKEFESVKTSLGKDYQNSILQRDDVLFLSNYKEDEVFKQVKLGCFILLNEKIQAQCLGIKEDVLIFLLTSKVRLTNITSAEIIQQPNAIGTNLGKVITDNNKLSLTPSLSYSFKRRNQVQSALMTGNILIDYINPLYEGNFNLLYGRPNLGQLNLLSSTAYNFLSKGNNNHVVYLTYSRREMTRLTNLFKGKEANYTILTLSENPSDSEYFYLPRIALNYIKTLSKSGSVLFCMDDVTTFILKEKKIYSQLKQGESPSNVIADIFEECGNYSGYFSYYSVSAIINAEQNKINFEFEAQYNKTLENIFSFSDRIIKFEPKIAMMKRYIPAISVDFAGLINQNIYTRYLLSHLIEMKNIFRVISEAHGKYEAMKKLSMQIDPWENYTYFDSKFFFDVCFNKRFMTEDKFYIMKFLIFIYYNDLLAHFKTDGNLLADRLITFISKQGEESTQMMKDFVHKVLVDKTEPTHEETEQFETRLEVLFDLFIAELKSQKEFSDTKEDYF